MVKVAVGLMVMVMEMMNGFDHIFGNIHIKPNRNTNANTSTQTDN